MQRLHLCPCNGIIASITIFPALYANADSVKGIAKKSMRFISLSNLASFQQYCNDWRRDNIHDVESRCRWLMFSSSSLFCNSSQSESVVVVRMVSFGSIVATSISSSWMSSSSLLKSHEIRFLPFFVLLVFLLRMMLNRLCANWQDYEILQMNMAIINSKLPGSVVVGT